MAEPSLKVVSDAPAIAERAAKSLGEANSRASALRMILLVVLPLIARRDRRLSSISARGRYISTDNAYVGAQKVLITPDISGKIASVMVREGQHVKAGDELFEIDPQPFRIARRRRREAKLAGVRTDFANLKTNLALATASSPTLAQQNVELKQRDVERKNALVANRAPARRSTSTTAIAGVVTAQLQAQLAEQQQGRGAQPAARRSRPADREISRLTCRPTPRSTRRKRDLDHTVLRAPIDGIATQVDNIQLGRFVTAGTPVFSRDRRQRALGRRQSEGNRHHLSAASASR